MSTFDRFRKADTSDAPTGLQGTVSGILDSGAEVKTATPPIHLRSGAWWDVVYRIEITRDGHAVFVVCDRCDATWDGAWRSTPDGVRPNVSGGWKFQTAVRDGNPTIYEEATRCRCRR